MRILFHHRTRGQGVEGVHISELVHAFRAAGHDVVVVSPPGVVVGSAGFTGHAGRAGGTFWRVVSRVAPELVFETLELLYNVPAILRLSKAGRLRTYDALYERYAFFNVSGTYAAGRIGAHLLLEVNYTTETPLYRRRSRFVRPVVRAIERYVFRKADALIVVSSTLKNELLHAGVSPERILVVPNAADSERFRPDISGRRVREMYGLTGKLVLGFVGGFYPWHGVETIIASFQRIRRDVADAAALLIGDGPLRAALERKAAEHGVADRVHFTGWVEHYRLPEFIAAFNVAVLPDTNEYGSPMKIYEYMAMGKPVVAPRLGPIEDGVIDGETGLLFPPGDTDTCIRHVVSLLSDANRAVEMGRRAREHVVQSHTWKANVARILGTQSGRPAVMKSSAGA